MCKATVTFNPIPLVEPAASAARELTRVAAERAFKNLLRRKATDKKVPLHRPFSSAGKLNQWKRFRGWVHRKTHREKEEPASGVDAYGDAILISFRAASAGQRGGQDHRRAALAGSPGFDDLDLDLDPVCVIELVLLFAIFFARFFYLSYKFLFNRYFIFFVFRVCYVGCCIMLEAYYDLPTATEDPLPSATSVQLSSTEATVNPAATENTVPSTSIPVHGQPITSTVEVLPTVNTDTLFQDLPTETEDPLPPATSVQLSSTEATVNSVSTENEVPSTSIPDIPVQVQPTVSFSASSTENALPSATSVQLSSTEAIVDSAFTENEVPSTSIPDIPVQVQPTVSFSASSTEDALPSATSVQLSSTEAIVNSASTEKEVPSTSIPGIPVQDQPTVSFSTSSTEDALPSATSVQLSSIEAIVDSASTVNAVPSTSIPDIPVQDQPTVSFSTSSIEDPLPSAISVQLSSTAARVNSASTENAVPSTSNPCIPTAQGQRTVSFSTSSSDGPATTASGIVSGLSETVIGEPTISSDSVSYTTVTVVSTGKNGRLSRTCKNRPTLASISNAQRADHMSTSVDPSSTIPSNYSLKAIYVPSHATAVARPSSSSTLKSLPSSIQPTNGSTSNNGTLYRTCKNRPTQSERKYQACLSASISNSQRADHMSNSVDPSLTIPSNYSSKAIYAPSHATAVARPSSSSTLKSLPSSIQPTIGSTGNNGTFYRTCKNRRTFASLANAQPADHMSTRVDQSLTMSPNYSSNAIYAPSHATAVARPSSRLTLKSLPSSIQPTIGSTGPARIAERLHSYLMHSMQTI
ncbi:hypothetical protein V1525DRAFT_418768 [Lipomyces kononenkoae]|uniref:Uncharacterized protein n=1 Tax=Lipomyces kononenkoae TaxID=34357 RepID=A0ACC3T3Z3_LIPKO